MAEGIVVKYWTMLADRHDARAFSILDAGYREPHRSYHSWKHIVDMLGKLDHFAPLATRVDLIAAAIFWHDSVYATREADGRSRPDAVNVRDSAALFARHSAFGAVDGAAVHDIIMATASHGDAKPTIEHYAGFADDFDLFLDLDLSSLAAPRDEFTQNTADIRFEYSFVPEAAFREGRRRILQSFLREGSTLYRRAETRALWEAAARANLAQSIAILGQTDGDTR